MGGNQGIEKWKTGEHTTLSEDRRFEPSDKEIVLDDHLTCKFLKFERSGKKLHPRGPKPFLSGWEFRYKGKRHKRRILEWNLKDKKSKRIDILEVDGKNDYVFRLGKRKWGEFLELTIIHARYDQSWDDFDVESHYHDDENDDTNEGEEKNNN